MVKGTLEGKGMAELKALVSHSVEFAWISVFINSSKWENAQLFV